MRYWVAVVSEQRYVRERLYAFETVLLPPAGSVAPGDVVALVAAGEPPLLFGLGRVRPGGADLTVGYTHRLFDTPVPVTEQYPPGLHEVSAEVYADLTGPVGPERRTDADKGEWFVTVALPIEAASPAEAVREFWTYVDKLGPSELPAFVWPKGDELAMQAYVLGEETNLDPEEDE